MILGIDVSHWNRLQSVEWYIKEQKANYKEGANVKFMFAKLTEGSNYIDPTFGQWKKLAERESLVFGSYHFARPDKDSAKQDAINFLNQWHKSLAANLKTSPIALDWEQEPIANYDPKWAKEWLDYVAKETGIKPLLYLSESMLKIPKFADSFKSICYADYGIWVANRHTKVPRTSPWKTFTIWQLAVDKNFNLDIDYFNGTKKQLKEYGKPKGKAKAKA